jgi:hypothetical protein
MLRSPPKNGDSRLFESGRHVDILHFARKSSIFLGRKFDRRAASHVTQFAIVNATPAEKSYKLSDGAGLSLLVEPSGSKLWRFRYFFGGRETMMRLAASPAVPLSEARRKRDDAKKPWPPA